MQLKKGRDRKKKKKEQIQTKKKGEKIYEVVGKFNEGLRVI